MRNLPKMNGTTRLKDFMPKKRAFNETVSASSTSKRRAVENVGPASAKENLLDSQSSFSSLADIKMTLSPDVDPDALYRGYIHPSRRDSQALPPDPPPFRTPPSPPSSSHAQLRTPPSSPSSSRAPTSVPLIISPSPLTPAASPVPSSIPSQSSLCPPPSPVPSSIPPTQMYTPTSEVDHSADYEAVMIALGDDNRLSRYLFRGGAPAQQHWDPTGVPTTREDVVEVLVQLQEMLHRLFSKFPNEA